MLIGEYGAEARDLPAAVDRPALVHVSNTQFQGHACGRLSCHRRALVETLAEDCGGRAGPPGPPTERTARRSVPTGSAGEATRSRGHFFHMVSPADLRHLRDLCSEWGTGVTLVPDYSETLDGPSWADFERTPAGGRRSRSCARSAVRLQRSNSVTFSPAGTHGGTHLKAKFNVPAHRIGLPIGVAACDEFFAAMAAAPDAKCRGGSLSTAGAWSTATSMPTKYLAGKKAVVYGEEDLVAGLAVFLAETGSFRALASGGRTKHLARQSSPQRPSCAVARRCVRAATLAISRRGSPAEAGPADRKQQRLRLARSLGVPLVRCGFPVHDRIGHNASGCSAMPGHRSSSTGSSTPCSKQNRRTRSRLQLSFHRFSV